MRRAGRSSSFLLQTPMKTNAKCELETTVAATVSGEDVSCGDYVALLSAIYELPTYLWTSGSDFLPASEIIRLKLIPDEAGAPLKVFAICLPFVYALTSSGEMKTLDLRRQQIVRLDRGCAKQVWKQLRENRLPSIG
jgi:hypothetical protein